MLYTKPINKISYQDVVDFCSAGHPEGFILEYKRDFPSNNEIIAKTIAAFANTYGGLLIVGVDAPSGNPMSPFEGIVFDPSFKYEEKIQSIVLSHIKEPVFPEVQVCDAVDGKTFIVIRVSESYLTPHRVSGNRKIYIRTGQSSTPNEEATWDKIEWLASRRKKSEEFRELLIEEGDRYFRDACKMRGIDPEDRNYYFAILSIGIVPLFPQEPLVPFKNLDKIENDITVHYKYGGNFPHKLYQTDSIQNGVRKLFVLQDEEKEPVHGKAFEYTHLNSYGLYLYKRDIGEFKEMPVQNPDGSESTIKMKKTHFYLLSSELYQFLASAILFYKKLGYWGSVQIVVKLTNALSVLVPNFPVASGEDMLIPSDNLRWEKITPFATLNENMRDVVVEMVDTMAWSLGIRYFTEDKIRKDMEDNFGK